MEQLRSSVAILSLLLGLGGVSLAAEAPVTVSPGDTLMPALIGDACPTFSWGEVDGARSYELVVYRHGEESKAAKPVLRQTFAGSVHSWTPSLRHCLERGGRYAWSVSVGGEWSEPSLFEVAGAPSIDDVKKAMALLQGYLAEQADPTDLAVSVDRATDEAGTERSPAGLPRGVRTGPLRNDSVGAAGTRAAPMLGTPSLTVDGNISLGASSNVFKDGKLFLWSDIVSSNIGVGDKALAYTTLSGAFNTALGTNALGRTTSGSNNTALGASAMYNNSSGSENTAVGSQAHANGEVGSKNTAVGWAALLDNEGSYNTATGRFALYKNQNADFNTANGFDAVRDNTTGHRNTAVGALALSKNIGGFQNTAVGVDAMRDGTGGENTTAIGFEAGMLNGLGTNNILIHHPGSGGDNNVMRIGRGTGPGLQQLEAVYFSGIYNESVGAFGTPHPVYVSSIGKLGKMTSSRRFKKEIRDQGALSSRLLGLRPVTFLFKQAATEASQPLQFGLIAEEVAEVFPELVDYDEQGRPESVKYHLLSSLLLNELQKQDRRIDQVDWRSSSASAVSLVLLLIAALAVTGVQSRRAVGL